MAGAGSASVSAGALPKYRGEKCLPLSILKITSSKRRKICGTPCAVAERPIGVTILWFDISGAMLSAG